MSKLRDAAQQALGALETVLYDAYHRRFPECCGRPGIECCGNPNEAWTPEDNKIMDLLSPAQRQLSDALRAALAEPAEQEPVGVPQGWKLVPDVPTNEWINNLAKTQTGPLEDVPFADIYQCIAELLDTAPEAPQPVKREPVAWKHDCAALLTNDVELWIDACPHCGKPRPAPQPKPAEQEPLFLLHTGTIYGNQRGDWEVEANSGWDVDIYCDANPGRTVGLYPALPAAMPAGYALVPVEPTEEMWEAAHARVNKNTVTIDGIARADVELQRAVTAEREACAKVCDDKAMHCETKAQEAIEAGEYDEVSAIRSTAWQLSVCAAAIRARKEQT